MNTLSDIDRKRAVSGGLIALAAGAVAITAVAMVPTGDAGLARKMQAAFPNTHIASVKCGVIKGLCEVTAGKTVFYTDPGGRYAIVGSILDLKDRVDVTDRRIRELAAMDSVTSKMGAIGGGSAELSPTQVANPSGVQAGPQPAPATLGPIKIDLPLANAIVHHPGAPLKISVISDLNCGYCRMLFESLKTAPDIQVTEYPVQLLRPDSLDKAKLALCAKDRAAASDSLYFGGDVKATGNCSKALAAVEANTAFAKAHGISGTPTIVRADGQANPGFMPIDQLRAWIKASAPV